MSPVNKVFSAATFSGPRNSRTGLKNYLHLTLGPPNYPIPSEQHMAIYNVCFHTVTVNLSVHLPTFGVAAQKERSLQAYLIFFTDARTASVCPELPNLKKFYYELFFGTPCRVTVHPISVKIYWSFCRSYRNFDGALKEAGLLLHHLHFLASLSSARAIFPFWSTGALKKAKL